MAGTISIPTPNVPYGPNGVEPRLATADYLESVLLKVQAMTVEDDGDRPHRRIHIGGSNVTATVERLLADVAAALRAPEVPRRDDLIDTQFLARNIINQLGDAWAEAIPSERWVPVRQATNDVMDGWVSQMLREAVAAAWAEGYTVAHNGDRGWPDDRPWPADRARELAEWNPYRDERELCATCGGSGVCGSAPDAYYDCPDCSGVVVDLDDTRDDRVEP